MDEREQGAWPEDELSAGSPNGAAADEPQTDEPGADDDGQTPIVTLVEAADEADAAGDGDEAAEAEFDSLDEDDEPEDDALEVEEASDEPAAEGQPAAAAAAVAADEEGPHWYFVHCYSGQENKVRHNLEQRIASMGMKGKIVDVIVPTEEEIEVKDGKRRTIERRVYPGYILVNMVMNEETWYVVRNTPGVTGFVGMGNTPTPLRPEEVSNIIKRMEAEAPKVKVTFKTGQKVRIIDGPFNDIIGTVSDIDMDRTKVRVMVSFFGRETPVELDFLQVEKV
jgi:transcriptional antiterminator NusG